jgi:hypothetical protein
VSAVDLVKTHASFMRHSGLPLPRILIPIIALVSSS